MLSLSEFKEKMEILENNNRILSKKIKCLEKDINIESLQYLKMKYKKKKKC